MRSPANVTTRGTVSEFIDTSYDTVKLVADNIDDIETVVASLPTLERYLGAFGGEPPTRPDGSPLQDGDYFLDTTEDVTKYYDLADGVWLATDVQSAVDAAARAEQAALDAEGSATDAAASAAGVLASETNAANSAAAALLSETNAAESETNAGISESNADASQLAAESAKVDAEAAELSATASAAAALASEGNAATSETNAGNSAAQAALNKNAAEQAEADALDSANNASISAGAAALSQLQASDSAAEALQSENNASFHDTSALASRNAAEAAQGIAESSALSASNSEANAAQSALQASDSAGEALQSESISAANANFKGNWLDQTGAANVPYSVLYQDSIWMLTSDLVDVAALAPDISPDWVVIGTTGGSSTDSAKLGGQLPAYYLDPDNHDDTSSTNKWFTQSERSHLATIEANATGDQDASEIEALYEGIPDTNKFTDIEKSLIATAIQEIFAGTGLAIDPTDPQRPLLSVIPSSSIGAVTRVFHTGEQTTVPAGTFYTLSVVDRGTVAELVQNVTVDDFEKDWYGLNGIGVVLPELAQFPAGTYSGEFSVQFNSSNAHIKMYYEIYKADADGNAIDSGVTGEPVGSLAVRPMLVLQSGATELPSGDLNSVSMTGVLKEAVNVNAGERLIHRIGAEKVNTAGGATVVSFYTGNNHNTYYDYVAPLTSDNIPNASTVAGATVTDALDALDWSDADVKAKYEANANTNAFTDAEKDTVANAVKVGDDVSSLANDANYASSGSNISQFVNDAGYLTTELPAPIGTVFTRVGDIVAEAGDYAAFYLGIDAKAADSDKLDGIDSGLFARTDLAIETFDGNIRIGNGADVSVSALGDGQLQIEGDAYRGYLALDSAAMHVGTTALNRDVSIDTDETTRLLVGKDKLKFQDMDVSVKDIFLDNPDTMTVSAAAGIQEVHIYKWSGSGVFTIENATFAIGSKVRVTRALPAVGSIEIALDAGMIYAPDGNAETSHTMNSGLFTAIFTKRDVNDWVATISSSGN